MKTILKKLSITFFILLTFVTLQPKTVLGFNASGNFQTESGLLKTGDETGITQNSFSEKGVEWTIGRIIAIALSLVGILFFILMVYSGYIWMMDRGNEKDIQKAKDNIITALVGLIIVFGAYAIVQFIIPLFNVVKK